MALTRDIERLCHVEAKRSKHRIGYFIGVCSKENQIARFDVERLFDASEFLIGEELDDGLFSLPSEVNAYSRPCL